MSLSALKTNAKNSPKPSKILIVEDNLDHWSLIRKAVEKVASYIQPVLAQDIQNATEWLEHCLLTSTGLPRLILLDLYLPRREDGWQVLQRIRDMSAPVGQLPIVILSASTDPADVMEAYERGCNSYLVKPTTFAGWVDYIEVIKDYWWEAAAQPNNARPLI